MGFFNNPENNSIKVILIVLVLAGAGYFVYQNMNNGNEGRVLRMPSFGTTSTTGTPGPARMACEHANTFQTISGNCVFIDGACTVHETDSGAHTGECTGKETVPKVVKPAGGTTSGTNEATTNQNPVDLPSS